MSILQAHKRRRRGAGKEHASTRARGRVASLSGIDRPILSATLLSSRMSSQSRYGTRSRLASEATLSTVMQSTRSARRGIGDIDDVRAVWNNGYEVLSLASVHQPSDEIDKRVRLANSSGGP